MRLRGSHSHCNGMFVVALAFVVAAPITAAGFFPNPGNACAVHKVRNVSLRAPSNPLIVAASYREACNVRLFNDALGVSDNLFDPAQYDPMTHTTLPETSVSQDPGRWPLGTTQTVDEVDLGYRYPLRVPSPPRVRQDMALDSWPVCALQNPSGAANPPPVVSDPTTQACPVGYEEVGRCKPSAHYYEKIDNAMSRTPAYRFYDFVLTHSDCIAHATCRNCNDAENCPDVCAHDVLSLVDTCKALCRRYFGRLRFKADPPDAPLSQAVWEEVVTIPDPPDEVSNPAVVRCPQDPQGPGESPPGNPAPPATLANTCINQQGFCNAPIDPEDLTHHPVCGMTPLQICLNNCGPPFRSFRSSALVWSTDAGDLVDDTPPWISRLANRRPFDLNNHWHHTNYGRNWNPNEQLDNWVRSYAVNRDKEQAPSAVCASIVGQYCNVVVPFSGPHTQATAKRAECKKFLLPANWSFPLPPGEFDSVDQGPPDFCDHFFFGNYLCPQTCYSHGNDGHDNNLHQCETEAGELGGGSTPCERRAGQASAATCCATPPCSATAGPPEANCCPNAITCAGGWAECTCAGQPMQCSQLSCCEPRCVP